MRHLIMICIMLGLLLAACSSPQPTAIPTPQNSDSNDTTSSASALKDYVASDPAIVRNTGRPQVIEFFAFWCTTCQAMRPVMHELQDQYNERVDFVYLDIDADATKALREELNFTGLRPTIVFLSADGVEISRMVGAQSKTALIEQIEVLLTAG